MNTGKTIFLLLTVGLLHACKKNEQIDGCFPGAATTRFIVNRQATVKLSGLAAEPVYLYEEGTIDTRLIPCNFPEEYRQQNLRVNITGEVKAYSQPQSAACCTENFVITKISR